MDLCLRKWESSLQWFYQWHHSLQKDDISEVWSQDGRGIGRGDHFFPHKFIKKIIWMLSNFHKATSECWQRTPGAQKDNTFSLKGGRTKYKRKKRETRELGMETHPGEGVVTEENFPNSRKLCHRQVCGELWNLRGKHNQEENKETNQSTHRKGT